MYPQFLNRLAVAALLGATQLGCSIESEPLAGAQERVLGGEPSGSTQDGILYVTAEVRNLSNAAVVKIGSGTLVAPNLLLTALHVVSKNPSNVPFACDASGNAVSGGSGALLGPSVAPEKVAVYAGPVPNAAPAAHGTQIVSSGSTTICENDIAFVVLDSALDFPTFPIHRGAPIDTGARVTVVGYGSVADAPSAEVTRTERSVDVTAVGQWIRTFTVSEGPCEGDSGGPALNGAGELVGVFSSVSASCTGPTAAGKYTDVSYFGPLVEQAFDAASAGSPWTQRGQEPTVAEGGQGAESGQGGQGVTTDPAGAAGAPTHSQTPAAAHNSGCAVVAPHRSEQGAWLRLMCIGAVWGFRRHLLGRSTWAWRRRRDRCQAPSRRV